MKERTVKTQKEYDAVTDQEEDTRILIDSSPDIWLEVRTVRKNTLVVAWGSSHVVAWGSSHVEARESSHVEAWESSHVEAWEFGTITKQSTKCTTRVHGKALLQDASQELKFTTLKEWFSWWDLNPAKGKVRMYKAIRPDGTDFYTGKVHYEVGKTIECPDWKEDYKEECGHAFHCSPHLWLTNGYASHRDHIHIAVEVAVKDIRLSETFSMPDKIRVRKLKVIEILPDE